jgi:protein O-mannosyl-transferase
VLLYDRAFLAGSFREAWRRRWGLYLALSATWALLGWLIVFTHSRGGSAGFGTKMSNWVYLRTQFGAVVHYLRLSLWPDPLVLDYGTRTAHGAMEIVPYAIIVGLLALAALVALWRRPKIGLLGVWFFAILAPTSSIVPVATQTMAEHRMYLPLAAIVVGAVIGGYASLKWLAARSVFSSRSAHAVGVCSIALLVIAFAALTARRNYDYRGTLAMWQDIARKVPKSERAHVNLASELIDVGSFDDAIAECHTALALKPDCADAYNNLGQAYMKLKRRDDAVREFQEALRFDPDHALANYNLGVTLIEVQRTEDAVALFRKSLAANPNFAEAHYSLANALVAIHQPDEAIDHYRKALESKPNYLAACNNLGNLFMERGRIEEAIELYQKAVKLNPNYALARRNLAAAHFLLGNALVSQSRFHAAADHYRKALAVQPDFAACANALARLVGSGKVPQ